MTNVKVTLKGKKGKEFEALVPISTACKVLFEENDTNICKVSYSVVHKLNDYVLSKVNAEGKAELNKRIAPTFALMKCTPNILFTNGVMLYRD